MLNNYFHSMGNSGCLIHLNPKKINSALTGSYFCHLKNHWCHICYASRNVYFRRAAFINGITSYIKNCPFACALLSYDYSPTLFLNTCCHNRFTIFDK